jgi:hypothetical protein
VVRVSAPPPCAPRGALWLGLSMYVVRIKRLCVLAAGEGGVSAASEGRQGRGARGAVSSALACISGRSPAEIACPRGSVAGAGVHSFGALLRVPDPKRCLGHMPAASNSTWQSCTSQQNRSAAGPVAASQLSAAESQLKKLLAPSRIVPAPGPCNLLSCFNQLPIKLPAPARQFAPLPPRGSPALDCALGGSGAAPASAAFAAAFLVAQRAP